MPKTVNINVALGGNDIAGGHYTQKTSIEVGVLATVTPDTTVGPAKTGTLTTRTSDTVGTLTMTAGHGIATGNRIDLFWSGGHRRGVVVGTVATNSVPITGGSGDVLPAATTAITAMVPVSKDIVLTGNNLELISGWMNKNGVIVVTDAADAELHFMYSGDVAGGASIWSTGFGTNPLAGDTVGKVFFSTGDSTGSANMEALFGY
jgi:hypothetical protein